MILPKNVCVIGAGPSGLAAIRHISASPSLRGLVFEQGHDIGGVWCYTEETGAHVHTALYKDLRTNLSTDNMTLSSEFRFIAKSGRSFPSQDEVVTYLHNFVDHFQLWEYIKFHTKVVSVKPIFSNQNGETNGIVNSNGIKPPKWLITIRHLKTQREETLEFDSVIVCNGHYSTPYIPVIEGLEKFQGHVFHSRDYRNTDMFKDKRVVVLGCGPSGTDVTLEVAKVAKEITMSFRTPPMSSYIPPKVRQVSPISTVTKNGFIFEDGTECEADILVLCTGYRYDFPFLDKSCGVNVAGAEGRIVEPLYRHVIHTKYPTLGFIGLPSICIAFYMFDLQAQYYVKYLEGYARLPSESEMNEDTRREQMIRLEMGWTLRETHNLGGLQWKYFTDMANDGGFTKQLKPALLGIYNETLDRRTNFAAFFRNDVAHMIDDDNYTYERCPSEPF